MSQENVEIVRFAYEEGHAKRTVDVPRFAEVRPPPITASTQDRAGPDSLFTAWTR